MRRIWAFFALSGIIVATAGCGTVNTQNSATPPIKSTQWFSFNASSETVSLNLDANYNATDGGMNFNGYSHGDMIITVPEGWRVNVTFKNDSSSLNHSALVVPFNKATNMSFSPSDVAFAGAMTPEPSFGTLGGTMQKFSFVADKSGRYAIVCGIAGHAAMGMWDTFDVSDSASRPLITTK